LVYCAAKLIKPGETATFDLTYTFPRNSPNHYQRANNGYIDIYVKAVKSRNNGDANDNGVKDPGDAVQNWNVIILSKNANSAVAPFAFLQDLVLRTQPNLNF
jgi:hypothetical protein